MTWGLAIGQDPCQGPIKVPEVLTLTQQGHPILNLMRIFALILIIDQWEQSEKT